MNCVEFSSHLHIYRRFLQETDDLNGYIHREATRRSPAKPCRDAPHRAVPNAGANPRRLRGELRRTGPPRRAGARGALGRAHPEPTARRYPLALAPRAGGRRSDKPADGQRLRRRTTCAFTQRRCRYPEQSRGYSASWLAPGRAQRLECALCFRESEADSSPCPVKPGAPRSPLMPAPRR